MFLRAYSLVHALGFCTCECCTVTVHICCSGTASQSQGLSVSSDSAMTDDLGCSAYSTSTDAVF